MDKRQICFCPALQTHSHQLIQRIHWMGKPYIEMKEIVRYRYYVHKPKCSLNFSFQRVESPLTTSRVQSGNSVNTICMKPAGRSLTFDLLGLFSVVFLIFNRVIGTGSVRSEFWPCKVFKFLTASFTFSSQDLCNTQRHPTLFWQRRGCIIDVACRCTDCCGRHHGLHRTRSRLFEHSTQS